MGEIYNKVVVEPPAQEQSSVLGAAEHYSLNTQKLMDIFCVSFMVFYILSSV